MKGTLLANRYLLGEQIGAGGMGAVHRAIDLRTGGTVAVKLLHPALAHRQDYVARLRREAQLAAALVSPRVVRVTDLDLHAGVPFLVMEYVPGETLAGMLAASGRLSVPQALTICLEVARALEAAHACGIVHRDLKPDNIKLVDGQVKVLDFGIAKAEADGPSITTTGEYIGTPAYSAPERVHGLGDIRADIYALGAILFELLEGRPPFIAPSSLAVLRLHESAPPPPLTREAPPAIATIVARCLAKRPEDRYAEPAALRDALESALDDVRPFAARPPARPSPEPRSISALPPAASTATGLVETAIPTSAGTIHARQEPASLAQPAPAEATESRPRVSTRGRRTLSPAVVGIAVMGIGAAIALVLVLRRDDDGTVRTSPRTVVAAASSSAPTLTTPARAPAATTAPTAVITTLAGSGTKGFVDGRGDQARFADPTGVAVDLAGNIYVADSGNNRIRRIDPAGTVTTLAGSGVAGFAEGAGAVAQFSEPNHLAVDRDGTVYVTDGKNRRVRKIAPTGVVSTLAGTGSEGNDDGPARTASFSYPSGIAIDDNGALYVLDYGNDAVRIITPEGVVRTLAGGKETGFADGRGNEARFDSPAAIDVDAGGTVYVADGANHRVRKVTPDGIVSTFAGSGIAGTADGPGPAAQFNHPNGVALGRDGNLYVIEFNNNRIRRVTPDGAVATLDLPESFANPWDIAVAVNGDLYMAETGKDRIRRIRLPK